MNERDNSLIVQRFFDEVWNQGRLERVDLLVDAEFINFGRRRGRDGMKVIVKVWRTAFPDLHINVEEEVAAGDRVVQRVTCTGTHLGEFRHLSMGVLAPTGKRFSVQQIHIFRVLDGRITEHTAVRDDLEMLLQLGAVHVGEIPSEESRSAL